MVHFIDYFIEYIYNNISSKTNQCEHLLATYKITVDTRFGGKLLSLFQGNLNGSLWEDVPVFFEANTSTLAMIMNER